MSIKPCNKVGSAIDNFATTPISVIKHTAGTYTNGRFTEGTTTAQEQKVSVQPMTGRDLQLLPEGLRVRNSIVVFSREELKTADTALKVPADQVVYKSRTYEVHTSEDWSDHGGFYRTICIQEGQG